MREHHRITHAALQERWPHLFSIPVPLKIGIHKDYAQLADPPVSKVMFSRFLFMWVRRPAYKKAIEKSSHRYDLDGRMCEMVTKDTRS